MLKIKLIGTGAAGNKAVIEILKQGVVTEDNAMLINSTARDLPQEYRSKAILLPGLNGAGKQRNHSKTATMNALKDQVLNLDSFVDPDDEMVVIVTSIEGGTGSGSSVVIAKYIKEVIGMNVAIFGFDGFGSDVRSKANTLEFMQELSEDYHIEIISNNKFLDGNNNLKAEQAANNELVKRLEVLIARGINDSDQNIDDRDLYKVSTTSGYAYTDKISINGIKNIKDFNQRITDMLDDTKSMEISEKSLKRLAVFLNIKEKSKDFIDYNFTVFKERLGLPYEVYTHVQETSTDDEYVSYIATGMLLPIDEVKKIYDKYKEESDKVNKARDSFFDFASELSGNSEDSMFDVDDMKINNSQEKRNSFFASLGTTTHKASINNVDISDEY